MPNPPTALVSLADLPRVWEDRAAGLRASIQAESSQTAEEVLRGEAAVYTACAAELALALWAPHG